MSDEPKKPKRYSRAELASRHTQTAVPANFPAPSVGIGLPGISGPGGVRLAPGGGSWQERVRGRRNWSQEL